MRLPTSQPTLPAPARAMAYAPPLRSALLDGGAWHLSDWQQLTARMDDLRAEGRRVVLHSEGRGYVRLRFSTLAPERFRASEGSDAAAMGAA
jgi:hypothetical protein